MAEQEIPWRDIVAVLHRRRRLILKIFAPGLVAVLIGIWLEGPRYRTTATLMITSDRAKVAVSPDASTRPIVERVTDEDLNSEAALLKSETLIREVLEPHQRNRPADASPGLLGRVASSLTLPFRLPGILYRALHDVASPTPLDKWVYAAAGGLSVSPVTKSNLIRVSYESGDAQWAARFVNELIAHHIERHGKLNQQSVARRFFESQSQLLGEKSRAAEDALQAFYVREGVEATPEQRKALRVRLGELDTAHASSQTELAEGTARIAFLTDEIRNYPKTVATESRLAQTPTGQVVKPRILDLELQRSELLAKYALTSVKVQDIDRQIAEAKRLLTDEKESIAETASAVNPAYQALEVDLAQTRAQMAAVQARVQTLESQIADARAKMAHLDEIGSEQESLEQEVAAAKEAYATYSKKVEEARFTSALDESSIVNIAVAEPAEVPAAPERSKTMQMLVFRSVICLMAAVGFAFVRDRLDPAVKSAAEAHSATGLAILAEVSR